MRSDSSRPKHILASPVWRSADKAPSDTAAQYTCRAAQYTAQHATAATKHATVGFLSVRQLSDRHARPVLAGPGQNSAGTCGTCTRPSVRVGDQCCSPADLAPGGRCVKNNPGCAAGETPVGPSNACCPSGQTYSGSNGAQACCLSGHVANGQCLPPPPTNPDCSPGSTSPQCCSKGYVSTGKSCCLAGQMTSAGTCCPSGQMPGGANKNQCIPIVHIPVGPQCCAAGQIPAKGGTCCPAANVTTGGACCSGPVDPRNRSTCPAITHPTPACAPGYTKMPDGSCCNNRSVGSDGKSCGVGQPQSCAPGQFLDSSGVCQTIPISACPPGRAHNSDGTCMPSQTTACSGRRGTRPRWSMRGGPTNRLPIRRGAKRQG